MLLHPVYPKEEKEDNSHSKLELLYARLKKQLRSAAATWNPTSLNRLKAENTGKMEPIRSWRPVYLLKSNF